MKKLLILFVVAALAANASALTTVFSDDFSGDLSGWNTSYVNPPSGHPQLNSVAITGSQTLNIVSGGGGSDVYGYMLTNLEVDLQTLIDTGAPGTTVAEISFDVVSHAPMLAAGAFGYGLGIDAGTELLDGGGRMMHRINMGSGDLLLTKGASPWNPTDAVQHEYWKAEYYVLVGGNTGYSVDSTPGDQAESDMHGRRITYQFNAPTAAQQADPHANKPHKILLDGVDVGGYLHDFASITGDVDINVGAPGFLMGWDRDIEIDNFQIDVIPEPATISLLGIGLLGLLRKRR